MASKAYIAEPSSLNEASDYPINQQFERAAIVSSPCFSCGLGHVIETLLLMDVKVDIFGKESDYWLNAGGQDWALTPEGINHLSLHSRYVSKKTKYAFKDKKSVLVEHKLSLIEVADSYEANILLVRDPIDAIYSWFRRSQLDHHGLTFEDYLAKFCFFGEHYPYTMFQARPLDIFSLHCVFWLLYSENLQIFRYEDLRGNTEAWLNFLAKINIHRAPKLIRRNADKAKKDYGNASSHFNKVNHKGKTFEYHERIRQETHDAYLRSSIGGVLFSQLNYCEEVEEKDLFGHDNRLKDCLWKVCERTQSELNDGDGKVLVVDFLNHVLTAFNATVFGSFDYVKTPHHFVIDKQNIAFVRALRTTITFLNEVYKRKSQEKSHRLIRLIVGISSFLSENSSKLSEGFCFDQRIL